MTRRITAKDIARAPSNLVVSSAQLDQTQLNNCAMLQLVNKVEKMIREIDTMHKLILFMKEDAMVLDAKHRAEVASFKLIIEDLVVKSRQQSLTEQYRRFPASKLVSPPVDEIFETSSIYSQN